ncbi:pre-peptidase C-terminal domain-containing protein [Butyrivibrio sp. MB2005]|nr:pre-peptidase C-terminal domain-containing protein [Butyrivibrio sp. MB2005]
MYNPVNFGTGRSYTKIWTRYNDDLNFYASFTMLQNGYVSINATKPFDDYGEVASYKLYMYDSSGNAVWDCLTTGQRDIPTSSYNYTVGLKSGIYILRFDPSFVVYSGGISSTISINTVANPYWEAENNDSYEKATTLKLKKKYNAVYGENNDMDQDFFRFKVKKGKKYVISLGNYSDFSATSTIIKIYDPKKKDARKYGSKYSSAGYELEKKGRVTIKANKNGYYYIRLYNSFGYSNPGVKYSIKVKQK